jgi:hypothetical protein
MADPLETLILTEARKQGCQPNTDAMRQATIHLAGATLNDQGLIHLPNVGSIAPADFIRSLRSQAPESFAALSDKPPVTKSSGNLTADMKAEVAANRRQRALPSDWWAVRSNTTGTTAQHMAERERNWK